MPKVVFKSHTDVLILINSLMSVLYKLFATSDVSTSVGVHYNIINLIQIAVLNRLHWISFTLPQGPWKAKPLRLRLAAVRAFGIGPHLIVFVFNTIISIQWLQAAQVWYSEKKYHLATDQCMTVTIVWYKSSTLKYCD